MHFFFPNHIACTVKNPYGKENGVRFQWVCKSASIKTGCKNSLIMSVFAVSSDQTTGRSLHVMNSFYSYRQKFFDLDGFSL